MPATVLYNIATVPGHHEAAARQRGDRRIVLAIHRFGIDQEFAALRGAGGIEDLCLDGRPAAVLRRIIRVPRHHEAAARQRGDCGLVLRIHCLGIDQEFVALGGAGSIEQLGLDGMPATVLRRVSRVPRHHKAAVRQSGDRGGILIVQRFGIDQKLAALRSSGGVKDLCLYG